MPSTSAERFALREEIQRTQPFAMGRPVNAQRFGELTLETDNDAWLWASEPLLRRHMAVMGLSGAGKSKFLEGLCRHLMDTGNGFTLIDPHGDTAQAVADYAAAIARQRGDDYVIPRFHYLCPSLEWLFAFDPFAHAESNLPLAADAQYGQEALRVKRGPPPPSAPSIPLSKR